MAKRPGGNTVLKKEYAYIMASTLNQMVNYIPLHIDFEEFKFVKIFNITLFSDIDNEKKTEENEKWDKAFKSEFKGIEVHDIKINQGTMHNEDQIKRDLLDQLKGEDTPFFWNITGGQRPYLFAVMQIVKDRLNNKDRPNDIVIYLEGNKGKIHWVQGNCSQQEYALNNLSLLSAFKLMSFSIKSAKREIDSSASKFPEENIKLWKRYIEEVSLRKLFIESNKDTSDDQMGAVNKYLDDPELIKLVDFHSGKSFPFGYILEEMVVDLIRSNFKDKLAAIEHSVKLTFDDNIDVKNAQIDEFDILILTKTGQLINIECKSGCMDGDVAKSTKYSTYAVSGVYGLPVLITPLTKNEIANLGSLKEEYYKAIKSSVNAAKRANLEVWGIDEIKDKLTIKINN